MSRRSALAIAAAAVLALPLAALSVTPGNDRILVIEPNAVVTQPICFRSKTVTAIDSVTVEMSGANKPDPGSPGQIVTAQACTGGCGTGCEIRITFTPANGCANTDCRAGRWYQVRTRVTDSAGDHPTFNFLVQVAREDLDRP